MSPRGAGLALVSSSLVTVSFDVIEFAILHIYSPLARARIIRSLAVRCRDRPNLGAHPEQRRQYTFASPLLVHLRSAILVECRRLGIPCAILGVGYRLSFCKDAVYTCD